MRDNLEVEATRLIGTGTPGPFPRLAHFLQKLLQGTLTRQQTSWLHHEPLKTYG